MTLLKDQIETNFGYVQFGIQKSFRYHIARQKHYEFRSRMTSFLIIFLTAFSGYGFREWDGVYELIAPASVIFISIVDLLYRPSRMAAIHRMLANQFIRLDMKMTISGKKEDSDAEYFQTLRAEIETEEPPDLAVLNILSHNELWDAIGDSDEIYHVHWFRRAIAQWKDLPPKEWVKLNKYKAEKRKAREDQLQTSVQ